MYVCVWFLEMQPRALFMLGKHFYHWSAHNPEFLCHFLKKKLVYSLSGYTSQFTDDWLGLEEGIIKMVMFA
jgi:hypothetical protein